MERIGPRALSIAGALVLLGVVAVALAPYDPRFWGNVAWYWLPPAAVVVLMAVIGAPPGALAGTALVLGIYLIGYHAWVRESLAWLGYLFAMPGAALGGVAAWFFGDGAKARWGRSFAIASVLVAGGLAVASGVLCSTLMHCGS